MQDDTDKLNPTRRLEAENTRAMPTRVTPPVDDPYVPRRPPPPPPDSPFRLPLWSIVLMLFMVGAMALCVVGLLIALGGRTDPGGEPRLVVLTASPFDTPPGVAAAPPTRVPTLVRPTVVFRLQGPTLPPPAITPTAESVDVGKTVVVIDVGDQQLNVRDRPGVQGTTVIFRIPENQRLTIVEGPTQADGLTWWRIQSLTNSSQTGWAAANYLQVVAEND